MNNLTVFNFNNNSVRTHAVDGCPWFCLADVCAALGLKQATDVVRHLPEAGVVKNHVSYASGSKQLNFINEPNLYRLIFHSNKPQAQAFADWVYSEVLPAIRKTGSYGASVDIPSLAKAVAEELKKQQVLALPKPKPLVPDCISDFVADEIGLSDNPTPFSSIYQMFDLWCFAHDKRTPSSSRLSRSLQALGFEKTTDRRGNKAFRLGLKHYEKTPFRYGFTPVSKFCGSGVYKMDDGECYQIIKALNGNLLYTWFNPRTGQAEGPQAITVPESFEHRLAAKMTSRAEVLSLDGDSEFLGFAD